MRDPTPTVEEPCSDNVEQQQAHSVLRARVGNELILQRERRRLPQLLDPEEKLLDAARAGLGFGASGLLGVTNRRLLHVRFRHVVRRFRITSIEYSQLDAVEHRTLRGHTELIVRYDVTRSAYMLIVGPSSRAVELRDLVARVAEL